MDRCKGGYLVHSSVAFRDIFKVFVDPEECRVRLVIRDGEQLINRDL